MRLFLAVELDPTVRRAAARMADVAADRLRADAAGRGVAWVAAPNLHVTLKFLGEVDAGRAREVTGCLSPPLRTPGFDLSLTAIGVFPPAGPPRTIWIGVGLGGPNLVALEAEVTRRLDGLGFPSERRPYHPHVTLARVKTSLGPRGRELLASVPAEGPVSCRVDHLTLFESRLAPRGAIYSIVDTFALSGIITRDG